MYWNLVLIYGQIENRGGKFVKVEVLKSLSDDMVLWRYMSLDKLINLLDDGGLFFAPLTAFQKSDPFEGYPPAAGLKAMYTLTDSAYKVARETLILAEAIEKPWSPVVEAAVQQAREGLADRPAKFRALMDALLKGMLVSCWYYSEHQSEAMWKLYGDQGKGIAIRTTVGKLKAALSGTLSDDQQKTIFIGKVKYVDYSDTNITAADCVVDGHIAPLLKRISYSHENEVRAFLSPDIDVSKVEEFVAKPFVADCDVRALIEAVYVSPFASNSFLKAVKAVVGRFDLRCSVMNSDLLAGADELFRIE
ncbi:TPA: DUF2971 domain-containing protein [Pseudomonas putida]|nr:DUF2971 domain-containing protein [Pseudomonas putida]